MIQHVSEMLRPVVDEVIVVRSAELELPALAEDVRVIVDREPARGPLAGIRDGLSAMHADSAFVTSTDAPFLSEAYVKALFEFAGEGACAPVEDGFVQVLSAIYPSSASVQADTLLDAGKGRPRDLLESLSYRSYTGSRDEVGRQAWDGFNTPEAYLEIVRSVDSDATAIVRCEGTGPPLERKVPVGTLAEVFAAGLRALGSSGRPPESLDSLPEGMTLRLGEAGEGASLAPGTVPVGPDETVTIRIAAGSDGAGDGRHREMVR